MLWRKKQDMQCLETMYDTLDRVPKKGLTEKVAVEFKTCRNNDGTNCIGRTFQVEVELVQRPASGSVVRSVLEK